MSDRPDHNKPYPDDNEKHGLPEDAPNSPNPYEEDDIGAEDIDNSEGEIPRKRDDSKDDEKDPWQAT